MIASAVKEYVERREILATREGSPRLESRGFAYVFAFVSARMAGLPAMYRESESHAVSFACAGIREFFDDYVPFAGSW
jgi:hypothetical protein